jgi:hypothetical protein
LSNQHIVLPWCTQALDFIELAVGTVNSQGFNGSFAEHLFGQKRVVAKMLRQQKVGTFFNS